MLVISELGLSGKHVFPITPWDTVSQSLPSFQFSKHLIAGGYLGGVFRMIIIAAVRVADLLDGVVPTNLNAYALRTETVADMEADTSPTLIEVLDLFLFAHLRTRSRRYYQLDISYVRQIIELASARGATCLVVRVITPSDVIRKSNASRKIADEDVCITCNETIL